ncbi:MAG TPA: hypothetical protein VMV12_07980 [Candidatus Micrarchaeaceae archaeon]|nr:hypothetical protein [Candidatus Micrarchaeaceae archaeon]
MAVFRFTDNLDGEAEIALGLPAPRLILAGLGGFLAWALGELPLPTPLRLGIVGLVAMMTGVLAWGKVQGVSAARWAWLALLYAGRVFTVSAAVSDGWVDARPEAPPPPCPTGEEPSLPLVAFVSLRRGLGCTTLYRAVASELRAEPSELGSVGLNRPSGSLSVVAGSAGDRRPALLLVDWGSGPMVHPRGAHLAGVVMIWDGSDRFPGEVDRTVAHLRHRYPQIRVLVAFNRTAPAASHSAPNRAFGYRLVGTTPPDQLLGPMDSNRQPEFALTSQAGIGALAREVLAVSRSR